MTRVRLTVPIEMDAPADVVWQAVTDWERQSEWMLATRVEVTSPGEGRQLGATLRAVTGIGPLRFVDAMEIVEWTVPNGDGPHRCVVRHTGRVVRGDGVFEVVPLGPARSRLIWSELLDIPLGALGRVGWLLAQPVARAGVLPSLRRLARDCEAEYRASA
jgi:carbon monoxide dehydrogenase subunit G